MTFGVVGWSVFSMLISASSHAAGPGGSAGRLSQGRKSTTPEERAAARERIDALRLYSGANALTLPEGRHELAVFGGWRHGLDDHVEIGLNPVLLVMLPHLEAKLMLPHEPSAAMGVRGRVSYPTTFLEIVSKEGALGLLPKNSKPPIAIALEADLIGTSEWLDYQLISVWLGVAVAPHGSFDPLELPLLDFPFLYPRFAALHAPAVPRVGLSFEGKIVRGLHYSSESLMFLLPRLPDVERAFALEQGLAFEYRFSDGLALGGGGRLSHARYPVGVRTHWLPFVDVKFGF